MNKKLAVLISLLISSRIFAQSQDPEVILFNVVYSFTHVNNLNDKTSPLKKEMILCIANNSSRFGELATYLRAVTPKTKTTSISGMKSAVGIPVSVVNNSRGIISETMFQYPYSGKLDIVSSIGIKEYITSTSLPKIEWQLEREFKEISSYKCQKAVGKFAGRNYTVWFAPDLPFRSGPFKLSGLPGLIMEAEDDTREVRYIFKSIERNDNNQNKVDLYSTWSPIKISLADYNRAAKAYIDNPDTYMQQQLPLGSQRVQIVKEDELENTSGEKKKKFVSNPIELKSH